MDTEKKTKKVWVYRHGPKESGSSKNVIGLSMTLSKEGREVMRKIAAQFLADNGKPQMIRTSLCVRTYETGMIFAEVCDTDLPRIEANLTGRYQEWGRLINLVSEEPTAKSFYLADPKFIETEAETVFSVIKDTAKSISVNENAICVSHGALIEPTVALATKEQNTSDLTSTFPEDLEEGEAVIFVFDENNKFVAVEKQNR